jgi:serine O-acetyltransferase
MIHGKSHPKTVDESKDIIQGILNSYAQIGGINHLDGSNLPSRQSVFDVLENLKEILFPGYFESVCLDSHNLPDVTGQKVVDLIDVLSEEIYKSLCWKCTKKERCEQLIDCRSAARDIALGLMKEIPTIRELLREDAAATFSGDPAAQSEHEIILSYPGFLATAVYRIAHFLALQNVPLMPRMMTEVAHAQTGIDIHPGAKIGRRFCVDHGTGVVIGETAEIGDDVKLYQGVTLGALSVADRNILGKRHPTLGNNVTVYAKATILGGDTVIGAHSIVGGNVWLTHSVPEHTKIFLSEDRKQVLRHGEWVI